MIDVVRAAFQVSIRRACRTVPACRATYHYRSRRSEQAPLRKRIREVAETHMRYGYRRITVLLRREGWHVNVKRVHRLYRLEGLQMRLKPPRRRVMAKLRDDRSNATGPNQVWAMDWMYDELFDGRRLWVLTVVDTWSRVCPVMRVCRSATAMEVIDALEQARRRRSVSTKGASSPRKSLIYGPMRTASRWTSAAQASRPTMPTWKASMPRFGSSASAGIGFWI
jgi:putative transposase